jgi:DNA-binding NtrC family response regulator
VTKPPDPDRLLHLVARAAERQAMVRRAQALEAAHADQTPRPLIAESSAMKRVLDLVEQIAAVDATVLIQGESGTGKELIARAIHAQSPRHAQPLIAVNCAALPDTLIESELFGFEKGAFTGAVHRKAGKFELADGGTLFLDEIAELPAAVQAKLLRVLQEREIERLGGTRPIPIDVRILAATNQDLRSCVAERRFREDLYYRLNVLQITLPPLRDRREDVAPLANHFLHLHVRRLGKRIDHFAPEAAAIIERYPWPGNVRELEHAVQRAAILTRGPLISEADLALPTSAPSSSLNAPVTGTLTDLERHWILATLERCDGNQSTAAESLGIDRSTLHRKLRQYGVSG